ncbi:Cytochrome P460 [Gammaproteobacteria bacterium]
MNHLHTVALATLLFAATFPLAAEPVAPAPNGISLPSDYKDWRFITVLNRTDNNTLRVIVGNDTAIHAVREGQTHPWPNGAILGKLAWRTKIRANWESAIIPDKFQEVAFMIKDTDKFSTTGGWGFAKWVGKKLTPDGDDANFAQECFGCHTQVKDSDYVFIELAPLP